MRYVFGPVPSRRLGMSLGVDVIPYKTCTLDCVYCQLGPTTSKSAQRQSYVSKGEVLDELRNALDEDVGKVDFITLSGSGEPTLNSEIGEIIDQIKTFTRVPVAVLTNGSLLYRDEVRKDLSGADLVVPSLDAVTEGTFADVNRPHGDLTVGLAIEGLRKLAQEFRGTIWLEIMLVKGINDRPEELKQMAALVRNLRVDRIHLNTVARPPAEEFASPVTAEEMSDIASMFDSRAEVITDFNKLAKHEIPAGGIEDRVMSLLKRRPCTVNDIASSLGVHRALVAKCVDQLAGKGALERVRFGDKWFYEQTSGENTS